LSAVLIFTLSLAAIINVVYGISLLSILSYFLAKWENEDVNPFQLLKLLIEVVQKSNYEIFLG
jgi:hypothetical protein